MLFRPYCPVAWEVEFQAQFVPEFEALAAPVQDELLAHVAVLEVFGPQLGRRAWTHSSGRVTRT